MARLAHVTVAFGGAPAFTTLAEFDALMESDEPLVLRPTKGTGHHAGGCDWP